PWELAYEDFWAMDKSARADHIWQHLFVERTPISEAGRGVVTTLTKLGLDPNEKTLEPYRQWCKEQDPGDHVDRVMELAGVDQIVMTNEVFTDAERERWLADDSIADDPRFAPVLRLDPLLCDWPGAAGRLAEWGYATAADFSGDTVAEARRFLRDWIGRMNPIYVAMSLPPSFKYPAGDGSPVDRVVREILIPELADHDLPWAMMIGSQRQVNPALQDAGDMLGKADVQAVVNLCAEFPENRFLITMLSRENQHELCVAARKFGNLMLFGCWWFLNNPSIIREMTAERLELLGTSFVPQHSDARILDQLIYKWNHSRTLIGEVLTEKYVDLADAGWRLSEADIEADVRRLLRDNFRSFVGI
ncbi:MAG: hypothetical protein R3336_02950, partial [Phycisphaeraceae bacterium]|nr:hypothetical protein [Phycisphaeraceae bacterium]